MGAKAGSTFSVAISSSPSGMRFRLSSTKRPNGSCRPHQLRCRGISSMIPRQRIPRRELLEEKRPLRRQPEDHHSGRALCWLSRPALSCWLGGHEGALCLSPRVFNPLKADRQRHVLAADPTGKRNPEKLLQKESVFLLSFWCVLRTAVTNRLKALTDFSTSFAYCINETHLILFQRSRCWRPRPRLGQKASSARMERLRPARPF
jgi:hypothetical protein